ncbi:MAG: patatin-like phospholipase family protein [Proteobacteria bacterium]|nr:patatin-like phospholipase family protein [Pseudomonadota bacterium]
MPARTKSTPARSRSAPSRRPRIACPRHEQVVLVLQGGGALGAYQAGVYEGFAEAGILPDWVTGVSIGAINAALIAGNSVDDRLPRMREFWNRVSSGLPLVPMHVFDSVRLAFNRFSSTASATWGVPGFFRPRVPGPLFALDGTADALSFYDTSPLVDTLNELVDFERLNRREVRFAVGAVNVRSGNSVYFDNHDPDLVIGPEHVLASGALPPGFPPVEIDGEEYWDGGLVSNTPLWYVLDSSPHLHALVAQVDLFSARGELPKNLDEVLERAKDIQYSSKTRFNTTRLKDLEAMRQALYTLLEALPARLRTHPSVKLLEREARPPRLSVVHLINRRFAHSSQSKDYEFSRLTVDALWDAGRSAVRQSLTHPEWRRACRAEPGMHAFDLAL